jgi:hypothetical protein
VFGKTIEDNRKKVNVKLALSEAQTRRWFRKPNLSEWQIIDEDKALLRLQKVSVKLDKPIYVGFSVLELSKLHMYRLHYKCFKPYYNENVQLLYTDTDSFIYHIHTNDMYEDFANNLNPIFDFSNYPKNHPLYNEKNKKKLGFITDEVESKPIHEFIGLKSKLYSISYGENKEKIVGKGIQKAILKHQYTHNHYKNVLFKNKIYYADNKNIQSILHNIYSIKHHKLSHTNLDDKSYTLGDGITNVPFGYKGILKL